MRGSVFVAAIGACLVATAAARAGEEVYPVTGELARGGAFQGRVTIRALPGDDVSVRLELGQTVLGGQGQRHDGEVTAAMRATSGAAQVLAGLGATAAQEAPLQLTFRRSPNGKRWFVRLDGPDGVIATGRGEREAAPAPTTPTTDKAARWAEYRGVPFVRAPEDSTAIHESDPRQGQLGDCYFIAGLIAVARTRPMAIFQLIEDSGDGEYVVTLRGAGRFLFKAVDAQVKVDQRFPANAQGLPAYAQHADSVRRGGEVLYELWPMMIERAFAQQRGGYDKIEGGQPATVFALAGAKTTTVVASAVGEDELRRALDAALAANKPLTIFFPEHLFKRGYELHVVGHHAYVITGARDGGYTLCNPWGASHPPRPLTLAELRELGGVVQIGEM